MKGWTCHITQQPSRGAPLVAILETSHDDGRHEEHTYFLTELLGAELTKPPKKPTPWPPTEEAP